MVAARGCRDSVQDEFVSVTAHLDRPLQPHVPGREQPLVNSHPVRGRPLATFPLKQIRNAQRQECSEPPRFACRLRMPSRAPRGATRKLLRAIRPQIDRRVIHLAARDGQFRPETARERQCRAPIQTVCKIFLRGAERRIAGTGTESRAETGQPRSGGIAAFCIVRPRIDAAESRQIALERIARTQARIFLEEHRAVVSPARESGESERQPPPVADVPAVGILQLGAAVFEDRGELPDGAALR